ncbi:acyl-CoA dehydrogenase [Colwellia demingiae]|uniref:3-methylmercaptopropionyl-CoA dehydrogenase n=1 Tax=Colwellia demingiae TaxID=89401 RepID=A0A5C6QGG9_9GAMM|nr:acyl-CoA dehydrogenase C-terminal domain-containing protein [Colwellia demingiae]TWX68074.1 acyl-CoA dehydrogenase [Colwellia demingiae]
MPEYKAPIRDMKFVMQELLDCHSRYERLGFEDATPDMVDAILQAGAKIAEQEIAPLNQIGDEQGCKWDKGEVTTPDGFKEAYKLYVEGGWPTLSQKEEWGGQGMPASLHACVSEMLSAANHSFATYPGLSHGAMATLEEHGSQQLKEMILPKLVEGTWTGTMCLTEAHCGTDLGMLRTKAELNDDGSYNLSGSKIFISAGEHDMSENIVHIVIARIPGSPEGTKGISLFAVPKFNIDPGGNVIDRNTVECGSIEHKMGIKGSATCVINFDEAKGYLIGEINRGLNCMFTFMNEARLGVAGEGVAAADASFQGALAYARDRLQMRSLTGVKNPNGPADPIIVHPDVRRMLLTQKSIAEGGRALIYDLTLLVDEKLNGKDPAVLAQADAKLALLTPIAKAFLTEAGLEATSLGVQVYGGHGYISEWGMEQLMRDTKISCLYEGTTGIQALDLLARKVLGSKGALLKSFGEEVTSFIIANATKPQFTVLCTTLGGYFQKLEKITQEIGVKAMNNPDEIGAASVDYLMYAGYVTLGYYWLKMMVTAQKSIDSGTDEGDFYLAKIQTGQFYFDRVLPKAAGHAACIKSGGESMMAINEEHMLF